MGSEARRSKVFSWQRSAHARDLVLKMKRDYFRELQANHANTSVQYYAVNLFFDLLTTVINKSKLWLTTVLDEHFTELFI
jgi:hypothetical protein